MSDSYLAVGRVWELCGEDTVSDNDTSGMAARSVIVFYLADKLAWLPGLKRWCDSNEAVSRQPPAEFLY